MNKGILCASCVAYDPYKSDWGASHDRLQHRHGATPAKDAHPPPMARYRRTFRGNAVRAAAHRLVCALLSALAQLSPLPCRGARLAFLSLSPARYLGTLGHRLVY